MTFEEFDKFSEELIKECFEMRTSKGKEYAHSSVDRFANFKRISERKNVSPAMIASIYLQKHLDGIESFISTGVIHSTESVRGRIVDAITYLMLIAGILKEQEQGQKQEENNTTSHEGELLDVHAFQPVLGAEHICEICTYSRINPIHDIKPKMSQTPEECDCALCELSRKSS